MALMLRDHTTAQVVAAVTAIHSRRGRDVVEIPLLELVHASLAADTATVPGIVAPDERVVELIVDDGPFEAIAPAVWALAARGWNVVAISPARRMGEAHRALRSTPCTLQPWWAEGDEVRFGGFETP